jgi:hypothetical protein
MIPPEGHAGNRAAPGDRGKGGRRDKSRRYEGERPCLIRSGAIYRACRPHRDAGG